MDQFVDRLDELDQLQALYESDAAELTIIYGRRQIGKSELVTPPVSSRQERCRSGAFRAEQCAERSR